MKQLLLFCLFCCNGPVFGQSQTSVTTMDFVKIKNGRRAETLFYYENNWKPYRDTALAKGFINGYRIFSVKADSLAAFDLILVTEYADSAQFKQGEERFGNIIKALRPNGPTLLNALKPNEFRENLFFKEASTVFAAPAPPVFEQPKTKF